MSDMGDAQGDARVFEIVAHIDVPPRERAKTDFTELAGSDRSLRAKLHYLHLDGYSTTVRLPSGRVVPGRAVADSTVMDRDNGFGPRPECEHLVELVEGTWIFKDRDEVV